MDRRLIILYLLIICDSILALGCVVLDIHIGINLRQDEDKSEAKEYLGIHCWRYSVNDAFKPTGSILKWICQPWIMMYKYSIGILTFHFIFQLSRILFTWILTMSKKGWISLFIMVLTALIILMDAILAGKGFPGRYLSFPIMSLIFSVMHEVVTFYMMWIDHNKKIQIFTSP